MGVGRDRSTFLRDSEESDLEDLLNKTVEGNRVRTSKNNCQVTLNT